MFSKTLLHQERSHKYVTKQVAAILRISEKAGGAAQAQKPPGISPGISQEGVKQSHSSAPATLGNGGNSSPMIGGGAGGSVAQGAGGEVSVSGVGEAYTTDKDLSPFKAVDYGSEYAASAAAVGSTAPPDTHTPAHLHSPAAACMELLLRDCSLANELRLLFHGLRGVCVHWMHVTNDGCMYTVR